MADGILDLLFITLIMRASCVEVAVTSVDVVILKRLVNCSFRPKEIISFQSVLGIFFGEALGKSGKVCEAAGAFSGFKIMAFGNIQKIAKHSFLDKCTARSVVTDDALEPQRYPLLVGNFVAGILMGCIC